MIQYFFKYLYLLFVFLFSQKNWSQTAICSSAEVNNDTVQMESIFIYKGYLKS